MFCKTKVGSDEFCDDVFYRRKLERSIYMRLNQGCIKRYRDPFRIELVPCQIEGLYNIFEHCAQPRSGFDITISEHNSEQQAEEGENSSSMSSQRPQDSERSEGQG